MRSTLEAFLILVLTIGLWAGPACSSSLPETRPADFQLMMYRGGGMTRQGSRLDLSADGTAVYEVTMDDGTSQTSTFVVPAADLDRLWVQLRAFDFDDIETTEVQVHDRGGISVQLSFGTTTVNVSDAGGSFVAESSRDDWRAILAALNDMIAEHWTNGGVGVTVQVAESLRAREIELSCNSISLLRGQVGAAPGVSIALPHGRCDFHVLVWDGETVSMAGAATLDVVEGVQLRIEEGGTGQGLMVIATPPVAP